MALKTVAISRTAQGFNMSEQHAHHATYPDWECVIGLEVHVQLATKSKIFSGASTAYGAAPNTQACAIDLGLPGVLPVLNHEALNMAVKFGLSINAQVNKYSQFARKQYFYPDLPKGYQISQHLHPTVGTGKLNIILDNGESCSIGITRAHLEEDAGKSVHEGLQGVSGIDLNRAGTPLLEIVSEPDLRSAKQAVCYLKTLHSLVRYLEICDGNMQEGSFRCDANVSVRKQGSTTLGTRAEIKNINSFRFVERAINHEIERQIELLEDGGTVVQETRLYDPDKDETRSMRSKEEAHDYRYFPDPDLLPIVIEQTYIDQIKAELPELPWEKQQRFQNAYSLSKDDANFLVSSREIADYFEQCCQHNAQVPGKLIANWLAGDMAAALNRDHINIQQAPISSDLLSKLVLRIHDQTISHSTAKKIFQSIWEHPQEPDAIINEQGLQQLNNDEELIEMIDQVLAQSPQQIADYFAGKEKLFGFFFGKIMKASGGRANPPQLKKLLQQQLDKHKSG